MHVRYDMPDENNEKRRDRNTKHNVDSPEFIVPEQSAYLWAWYQRISDSVTRIVEGRCRPIPPSEFMAWSIMSGNIVNHVEYDILAKMDTTYCETMNDELKNYDIRMEEKRRKELENG